MADDIVDRVRAIAKEMTTLGQAFDCLKVADEIERLRAAGDQLHAWLTINSTTGQQNRADFDKVLNTWEEARRG